MGAAFLISGFFALPQAMKFNTQKGYIRDGKTLYIPMEICEPNSIQVDGNTISFEADDVGNCRTYSHLVNACIAGIVFAMAANAILFVFEIRAHLKMKSKHGTILGMSFFLFFIQIQAGACLLALYSETAYWTDYFELIYQKFPDYGITEVKTHGNTTPLFIALSLSFAAAGTLLLDSLCKFCYEDPNERPKNKSTNSSNPGSSLGGEEANTSGQATAIELAPSVEATSTKDWLTL